MMNLTEFKQLLEADVLTEAQSPSDGSDAVGGLIGRERAFTRLVLEDLEEAGAVESPVEARFCAHAGREDVRANGYSLPEQDLRLDIIITDYREEDGEPHRLNAEDLDRCFRAAERFFKFVVGTARADGEPDKSAREMIRTISGHKEEIRKVQIWLITNGVVAVRREKERPKTLLNYSIAHEVWDLERLRRYRASGTEHEPIDVDLSMCPGGGLACLSIADPAIGYGTSIALIPGAILADWYDEYGSRLLELNVRSYLQAKGKINKGILTTLQREPERFLAYNNGITLAAHDIEFTRDQSRISAIRGLQIVNGGQTTASVHRARKELRADLSHVYVQAKITRVPIDQFEEMVPQISRLSNTQNKVNQIDLFANHNFQVGIERKARKKYAPGEKSKWFYERARGSYQTERALRGKTKGQRDAFDREYPVAQRLSKEDIARYVNAFDGYPHIVSRGGQKSFIRFMSSLPSLPKDWEPPDGEFQELIGKAILFRKTQALATTAGISTFRINVVTYAVSLVAQLAPDLVDFSRIWSMQDLPSQLAEKIREWLPRVNEVLVESVAGRNPTEWFKQEACWTRLKEAAESWPVERKGKQGKGDRIVLAPDRVQIGKCKALEAKGWFAVYQWADGASALSLPQLEVVRLMTELAVGGWKREPTALQAAEALQILAQYQKQAS